MAFIRITDQYFWNFVFSFFFVALTIMGVIILATESYRDPLELTLLDFLLMTLASWRLTRLFVYDHITKFIREQFMDPVKVEGGYELVKPKGGPRRTLADLFGCPWCVGMWMATTVGFFYMLTPLAYYPVLFLAIAALATYLQLLANLTGHKAEEAKRKAEHGF
jgi:hypothetical protein